MRSVKSKFENNVYLAHQTETRSSPMPAIVEYPTIVTEALENYRITFYPTNPNMSFC